MQEQEAISQCQAGEQEALGILYKLHHQAVFRTAYGITRNYDMAEDITQQVFIELFTAIKRYDTSRPFPPWLHRIPVRQSLDKLRHPANRQVPIVDDHIPASSDPSPEQCVIESELRAAIWTEIGKLSPKHRAVIVLYYYQGFGEAEISKALGCFRTTVRTRLHYARANLRDALRHLREPPDEPGLANAAPNPPPAPIGPGPANAQLPLYGVTAGRMACSFIPAPDEVEPC